MLSRFTGSAWSVIGLHMYWPSCNWTMETIRSFVASVFRVPKCSPVLPELVSNRPAYVLVILHLNHGNSLRQDRSTVAQRAETTVAECSLTSCVPLLCLDSGRVSPLRLR